MMFLVELHYTRKQSFTWENNRLLRNLKRSKRLPQSDPSQRVWSFQKKPLQKPTNSLESAVSRTLGFKIGVKRNGGGLVLHGGEAVGGRIGTADFVFVTVVFS
ncbi:unnamed protein product [Cuscuta epithymum]|uniref:Uncharacterized protein n=1 Tax=Cuscuta epithymum TaxID=186058 RepID=A0AAV0EES8_9ASTE|nr:unnamed protein product [Cuscuta epithymum]